MGTGGVIDTACGQKGGYQLLIEKNGENEDSLESKIADSNNPLEEVFHGKSVQKIPSDENCPTWNARI
jgi:hypothetical protein